MNAFTISALTKLLLSWFSLFQNVAAQTAIGRIIRITAQTNEVLDQWCQANPEISCQAPFRFSYVFL